MRKSKKVSAASRRHAEFMIHTLAPDLEESGAEFTAKDVKTCGTMMRAGRTDRRYANWLQNTLIPDLRASGKRLTANDLARCAKAITPPKRRASLGRRRR